MQNQQITYPNILTSQPNEQMINSRYLLVRNNSHKSYEIDDQSVDVDRSIQRELLSKLDTQNKFWSSKSMPTGIPEEKRKQSRAQFPKSKNSLTKQIPFISKYQLKKIQQKKPNKINKIKTQPKSTNRSNVSRTSIYSNRSCHHNKNSSYMSEYNQQRQNQKLVQRLLCTKPSQEVSRQKQKLDYKKHLQIKNVMVHRFDDLRNSRQIRIKQSYTKCLCENTVGIKKSRHSNKTPHYLDQSRININNKQIIRNLKPKQKISTLRNMLQQEKRKNRQIKLQQFDHFFTIENKNPKQSKTLQPQLSRNQFQRRKSIPVKSYVLPAIRLSSHHQVQFVPLFKMVEIGGKKNKQHYSNRKYKIHKSIHT